ncbi:MAG: 6-phosphofructokinase [Candidatus Borkfalkiaceae bacterium]|nr:6-phosphofructokinase [Christensenellaceae bacterium]
MKKIAILTSGGDAPGMNATIRACVRSALNSGLEVYGVDRGYRGLVDGKIFPMNTFSVCDILQRGGTILKTARCLEFKEAETRKHAADNLKELGIEGLVVIGGDGSFTGAKCLSDEQGINVVGIPGTIDNDLAYTDYTLGFDTAVNTVLWAINALRDTMISHDRVCLVKVMGRRCGDIALYAGICGGAEYILVPEIPYDIQEIANQIKENKERGKRSNILVLAEGAGNENEIKTIISVISGSDVKITTLGHIQRGGTPTMQDRMLAAQFGTRAVELLLEGKSNRVIGIKENKIIDLDISDALAQKKVIRHDLYDMAAKLC